MGWELTPILTVCLFWSLSNVLIWTSLRPGRGRSHHHRTYLPPPSASLHKHPSQSATNPPDTLNPPSPLNHASPLPPTLFSSTGLSRLPEEILRSSTTFPRPCAILSQAESRFDFWADEGVGWELVVGSWGTRWGDEVQQERVKAYWTNSSSRGDV